MPVTTTPYATAETVLELIRAAINDMGTSTGAAGNLFANTQPYVFPLLNSAYRELVAILRKNGWETAKKETILRSVPAVASQDPGIQVVINYTGSNNGSGNFANPYLPPDLCIPLRLWERQSGTLVSYIPMDPVMDALPSIPQTSYLKYWQWRQQEGLYFVGATLNIDIRLEYAATVPNVLTQSTDPILILGGENALAYMTAGLFAFARGSQQSEACLDLADKYIGNLIAPIQSQKQRLNYRRRPYGGSRWQR